MNAEIEPSVPAEALPEPESLEPESPESASLPEGRGLLLDRLGFLALGAMFVPYMGWVFIAEREMFSRLPLLVVGVLFVLAMLVYYAGARHWLLHRKTRRARLALGFGALVYGFMTILIGISLGISVALCELLGRATGLRERFAQLSKRRVWWVTAAVVLLLFPAMNAMYGIHGGFRSLRPLVLMQNPFYQINAAGMRGPLLPFEKPPGTTRLLFLGDSSTFGWPYRPHETYPFLVQALLEDRGLGPIEVVNAGIPGQSVFQIRHKIENRLRYDPDVVVMMDGIHYDKTLGHMEDQRRYGGVDFDDHGFRFKFFPPWLPEMLVFSFISHPLRACAAGAYDLLGKNERVSQEELSKLAETLEERETPFLILEYPSHTIPQWVRDQQAAEAEARAGVDFVPLLHLFPKGGDHWSHNDGIHPDKEGHRRIAHLIVERLLALGWVGEMQPEPAAQESAGDAP